MTKIIKTQEQAEELIEDGVLKVDDDLKITCDINIQADIDARNIDAYHIDARNIDANNIIADDIKADDIDADDIKAYNIKAHNINFYAFCIAYKSLKCENAVARRENYVLECLDSEIEYKNHEHKFKCECGEVQESE